MDLSREKVKKEENQTEEIKEDQPPHSTYLEKFCDENPESSECRIYDV